MSFRVIDTSTGRILPGFPSPYLIGLAGSVEAYTQTPDDPNPYWYARVPGRYESKDGTYTTVRIEKVEDWRVDLAITPVHPDHGAEDSYRDYFIVKAVRRLEAEDLATARAHEDVADRYGEEYSSDVLILRALEGVST